MRICNRFAGQIKAWHARQDGFTLLESLIVLAILSLALAISVPALQGSRSVHGVRIWSAIVASDLKAARTSAVTRARPVVINFDPAGSFYTSPRKAAMVRLPASLRLNLETLQPTLQRHHSLIFYPDGSCSGARLALTEGREAIIIEVEPITARIAVKGGT